ncbi:MAG: sugar phosphate isomerase/epimerase [Microbacteriaceae bacterium]|nr:MAG: sugar phosphate isomerase/epimerase [Microbacteriaceae bacterium]
MKKFRYSYNALVYYKEDVASSFARVAAAGYDAIELVGEPDRYSVDEVNNLRDEYGIAVSSICSVWSGEERDLTHPEASVRRKAIDYGRNVADFASAVGAPVIIVGPAPVGKVGPTSSRAEERDWAIEGVRAIANHAASEGVDITLEAWNRYETYFINRLDQAVAFLQACEIDNGGVHGDMFHMNIEERSVADAYKDAGAFLNHVHLADTNRAAPGYGHADFRPVLKALDEIGFAGYLTFELLPGSADPFRVMAEGGHQDFLDKYTNESIARMREVEESLWG